MDPVQAASPGPASRVNTPALLHPEPSAGGVQRARVCRLGLPHACSRGSSWPKVQLGWEEGALCFPVTGEHTGSFPLPCPVQDSRKHEKSKFEPGLLDL